MTKETKKLSVLIGRCGCSHSYQDKKYGEGNRVMNPCPGGDKTNPKWRCTVCGREKTK